MVLLLLSALNVGRRQNGNVIAIRLRKHRERKPTCFYQYALREGAVSASVWHCRAGAAVMGVV